MCDDTSVTDFLRHDRTGQREFPNITGFYFQSHTCDPFLGIPVKNQERSLVNALYSWTSAAQLSAYVPYVISHGILFFSLRLFLW